VTNAIRHARARRLEVQLAIRAGTLELRVTDDGVGFDPDAVSAPRSSLGRLGLLGMRERAAGAGGACALESAPGSGTVVSARFPLRRSSRTRLREADSHPPRR
jgi:signal transduction histidine kinase